MFRHILASVSVIAVVSTLAHGQASVNLAGTTAVIDRPGRTSNPFVGDAWRAPNFAVEQFNRSDLFGGSSSFTSGEAFLSYSLVTTPAGVSSARAVSIDIPRRTNITQSGDIFGGTLRIDFQVQLDSVAADLGGIGYELASLPRFYTLRYLVGQNGTGRFRGQINYTSLTSGLPILPQQSFTFGGGNTLRGLGGTNIELPRLHLNLFRRTR